MLEMRDGSLFIIIIRFISKLQHPIYCKCSSREPCCNCIVKQLVMFNPANPRCSFEGNSGHVSLLDLFGPIPDYIFACSIADLVTFNTAFCALAVQLTNISP